MSAKAEKMAPGKDLVGVGVEYWRAGSWAGGKRQDGQGGNGGM